MSSDPVTVAVEMFRCDTYKINIPINKRGFGFCAKQFRKGREFCVDCERGKKSAQYDKEEVIKKIPPTKREKIQQGMAFSHSIKKEKSMAEKPKCDNGDGKLAVKDGLCYKCYRKKHGVAPFPSGQGKKAAKKKTGSKRILLGKAHVVVDEKCEGCELSMVEKVMVAAGIVPAEKFEQAREIIKGLRA